MITIPELQSMLRQFGGPLQGAEVIQHPLAPQLANIKGMCYLQGKPHGYDCELDIRGINTPMDVINVVSALLENMRRAEAQAGRT